MVNLKTTLTRLQKLVGGMHACGDQKMVRSRLAGRPKFSLLQVQRLECRNLLSGDFAFAAGFGNTANDVGQAIVTDGLGNVYTTGYFSGTVDFDPGAGTFSLSSVGSKDSLDLMLVVGRWRFSRMSICLQPAHYMKDCRWIGLLI